MTYIFIFICPQFPCKASVETRFVSPFVNFIWSSYFCEINDMAIRVSGTLEVLLLIVIIKENLPGAN